MGNRLKIDRRIERVIVFMFEHPNKPLKVAQLAKRANLSTSYFWVLFKQKTGYAPIEFFIRLRMGLACYLLNSTKLRVNNIAVVLGYKDRELDTIANETTMNEKS